jgi:hypothetical protein
MNRGRPKGVKNKIVNNKITLQEELAVVCKLWEDYEFPKEQLYLFKYFKNKLQQTFLRYYLVFNGNLKNFSDHTGLACSKDEIQFLKEKFILIEDLKKRFRNELDFDKMVDVEEGKLVTYHRIKKI